VLTLAAAIAWPAKFLAYSSSMERFSGSCQWLNMQRQQQQQQSAVVHVFVILGVLQQHGALLRLL
jgi:hypothetical protein